MNTILGIYTYETNTGYVPVGGVANTTWQEIVQIYPDGLYIRLKDPDGNIGVFHGIETNTINTTNILDTAYEIELPDIEDKIVTPNHFSFRDITKHSHIEAVPTKYYLAARACTLSQERVYRPTFLEEDINIDAVILETDDTCDGLLVYKGYVVPVEPTDDKSKFILNNAYHLTMGSYFSCIGKIVFPCGLDRTTLDIGNFDITHMTVSTSYSRIIKGEVLAVIGGIIIDPKYVKVNYNNITINLIDSPLLTHRDVHGPMLLRDYDPTWTGEVYMQKIYDLGFNTIIEMDTDFFFMVHSEPYSYGVERYAPYAHMPIRDSSGRIYCYKHLSNVCKAMITTNAHMPRWLVMWTIPKTLT